MSLKQIADEIRREQGQLLRTVELLRGRCGWGAADAIVVELEAFECRLREHVGLVAGVLDAVTDDEPGEPR